MKVKISATIDKDLQDWLERLRAEKQKESLLRGKPTNISFSEHLNHILREARNAGIK